MKTLTQAQAHLLRLVRPAAYNLDRIAEDIADQLATFKCPHEIEGDDKSSHMPQSCWLCKCYGDVNNIKQAVIDLCRDIDSGLQRGPDPKALANSI